MCLDIGYSVDYNVKTAEEDIIVYKKLINKVSAHRYFEYKLGLQERVDINHEFGLVHQGYHSWKNLKDHIDANSIFIIPKGTKYYEGDQHDWTPGFVSENIIYIGKIGTLGTRFRLWWRRITNKK